MNELIQSAVVVNEEQHTYTLGDKQLSGITTIIKQLVFPDMYKGISQAVLNKAAERGTRIHNLIQMWVMGILSNEDIAELQCFLDAFTAASLISHASEYLVSDNESVASSIDLVCLDAEGNFVLCDIKTTSVLHTEYLQWQLSIYAYLFEHQNPTLQVGALKAIHIRDNKCEIVDVERLPDEYVEALLNAYRSGAESFDNPLNKLPEGLENLLNAYVENDELLSYIKMVYDHYDKRKKEIQQAVADTMRGQNLSKIETGIAKVTIGKDSVSKKFDFKAFAESDIYKKSPKIYEPFISDSVTAGRVTITPAKPKAQS